MRRDVEFEPEELAGADDLGDRLAGDAPRLERPVLRERGFGQRLVAARDQLGAAPAERVREQNPRFERRQRRGGEQLGGGVHRQVRR